LVSDASAMLGHPDDACLATHNCDRKHHSKMRRSDGESHKIPHLVTPRHFEIATSIFSFVKSRSIPASLRREDIQAHAGLPAA